jgi:signal peptidase
MRGTLHLKDITQSGKDVEINLESNVLKAGGSGYLTMGDNPNNNYLDQQSSAIIKHLVGTEDILSVPILEIPWAGTLKILLKNNGDNLDHAPNSLPSFIMSIALLISLIVVVDIILMKRDKKHKDSENDDVDDESPDDQEDEGA